MLIITLGGEIAGDGNLQIYDEAARLVYSTSKSNLYAGLKFSVTIPSFASGVYTVILTLQAMLTILQDMPAERSLSHDGYVNLIGYLFNC